MEKDKKCIFKESACKLVSAIKNSFEFLEKKVEELDPKNNTKQRIISSIVLLPLAVYAIFFGKNIFVFLLLAITILMVIEWMDMIKNRADEKKWRVVGFFYILIPLYAVYRVHSISIDMLFWMFAIIWVTDIFAFFVGRILGGAKLLPSVSPNKTWSGLCGAVVASAVIGFLTSFLFVGENFKFFICASILLSLVEQASDLLESKFKRIFGVKDSGTIIPGHGGVLDRLDGLMLAAPFVLLLFNLFPTKFGG